ncbi:hypothetical protein ACFORL_12555 [Legionella dresdenensis]|uniref:Dot/Icm secretion system substrate n=1 Tax=Legionella dresdenensis TaxID=450200 RepID=A0ABV8CHZ7_9GAMM
MALFYNTPGGTYSFYPDKKPKAYTFPTDAYIEINKVRISLSGIKVNVHDIGYDSESISAFSKSAALVHSRNPGVINTPLYINDSNISDGVPSRQDLARFHVPFISPDEFEVLVRRLHGLSFHSTNPDAKRFFQLKRDFAVIENAYKNQYKEKIKKQLSQLSTYPKHLSIIYDDRRLQHATHIILTYHSTTECSLQIDSTISFLFVMYGPNVYRFLAEGHSINYDTCIEKINPLHPNVIDVYCSSADTKPAISFEFSAPIDEMIFNCCYARMVKVLCLLDIPLKKVVLHHTPYNNKFTLHCVPFAIQNKIDFVLGESHAIAESVFESGLRIRAEQAVLSYLTGGFEAIPHYDAVTAADFKVTYSPEKWYSNFDEVCSALRKAIAELSYQELESLYLSTEVNDACEIANSIKKYIKQVLLSKAATDESFIPIPVNENNREEAERLDFIHAPAILYSQSTATLFASKKLVKAEEQSKHHTNILW